MVGLNAASWFSDGWDDTDEFTSKISMKNGCLNLPNKVHTDAIL